MKIQVIIIAVSTSLSGCYTKIKLPEPAVLPAPQIKTVEVKPAVICPEIKSDRFCPSTKRVACELKDILGQFPRDMRLQVKDNHVVISDPSGIEVLRKWVAARKLLQELVEDCSK